MGCLNRTTCIALLALAANAGGADTNAFLRQVLTLPADTDASRFADVDGDGRSDLLAVHPVENTLLVYRQRAAGFSDAPDQVLTLPPHTAWVAVDKPAPQGKPELFVSTARGLAHYRQNAGRFEPESQPLFEAAQVFTNADFPRLVSLGTNTGLPVIGATQVVLYTRNEALEWRPGPPVPLAVRHSGWRSDFEPWAIGPTSARSLWVHQSLRVKRDETDEPLENDTIKKLIEDMNQSAKKHLSGTNRLDLNGDGRRDLVLWQSAGDTEPRTDVYVFLRAANGRLPERPSQVLHCHGFPIPVGSDQHPSPIADLNGDGGHELVLLELKTMFTSVDSLVEALVSRGLDWTLTIRWFKAGAFSVNPDATATLTALLPDEALRQWPMFIWGDFNGDGRPDIVVQRSRTEWRIFLSTANSARRNRFDPQPAMSFETPMDGYFEIADLNGDGRSDIILRALNEPRIVIFLSRPQPGKGRRP